MKTFISILLAATFAVRLFAEDTNAPAPLKISALDATNYYDKEMIVTGKVAQVTVRPTVTFLNLDGKYPDSPFAVVIIHGKSSFYGNANALKGRSIEVRGKITKYKDKPEMALDSTNQLTVIGVTNLDLFLKPKTVAPKISQPTSPPPANQTTNFPEIM
jgi:DNA/RNA endonuclease YhcR with UshA esterase domain